MSTALGSLQAAVYTALTADTQLMAIITGVFDDVQDGQAYPYVIIGEATENRFDTFANKGKDATLTIHAWSQAQGMKELQSILGRMDAALDQVSLSVSGWSLVNIEREFGETLRSPDGRTRQLVTRYRAILQA